MGRRRRFTPGALILLAFWPWLAAAGDARESDTRPSAGGGPTMVRLSPFPKPRGIPKTLEGMRRLTGDDFLCVERGDSLIASDLGPGEYEYLVDGVLDYCSAALRRVFFNRGAEAGKMISIFVFRNYASYEKGLRRFIGMEPISPYGHYWHSQKYIVINYETGPGTLVHELIHSLMSEDFPEAPIWIAEGLASLYEQCRA